MELINDINDIKLNNTAIALGKFEGLHKGHMLLIDKLAEMKKSGMNTVLCTIDMGKGCIFSDEEKQIILKDKAIDYIVKIKFTPEFASLTPEKFIQEILVEKFDVKCIVVGNDFRFGFKREGNVETLKILALKYTYKVWSIDKLKIDNEVVSSTRIREEIENCNMKMASELLGRNYFISGVVRHGKRLGNTIGFPTVNINPASDKILPKNGVYASYVTVLGKRYKSITNIGNNPTVNDSNKIICETSIFDFDHDIYGENIIVELCEFVRSERKFSSIDELKRQLGTDVSYVKGLKY